MKSQYFFQKSAVFTLCFLCFGLICTVQAQVDEDWFMSGQDMYANDKVRYVGIGTTTPESKLHVSGDITLENSNRIIFKNASGVDDGTYISRFGGNALRFRYTGNSLIFDSLNDHCFRLHNSSNQTVFASCPTGDTVFLNPGEFGIGTAAPSSKLHVSDPVYPAFMISGGSTPEQYWGQLAIATHNGYYAPYAITGDMVLRSITGDLILNGMSHSVRIGTGNPCQERVTITEYGNVGIGTINPLADLDMGSGGIRLGGVTRTSWPTGGDNLGNHRATQNIRLNNHWLSNDGGHEGIYVATDGNVGIGTSYPGSTYKLNVNGKMRADEVVINITGADFVFEQDYPLLSLDLLQSYINQHKHLPDIPSAADMEADGSSLGELQTKLLQKIEELTLYVLEQNQRIKKLEQDNQLLLSSMNRGETQ